MNLPTTQLNHDNYHADKTRISKSGLDLINKSPAYYWERYLNPNPYQIPVKEETKHFDIGDVFHTAVIEPNQFFKRYIIPTSKVDRRTRDGKSEWESFLDAAEGRKVINADIYDWAMRMRDAALTNPIVKELFSAGYGERICAFTEPETGAPCKCRPDWETKDNILVDLKSTDDASPDGFSRSMSKYRYYVQDAFYRDGIEAERGFYPELFIFVAVEKKPPFNVGLYTLSNDDVMKGREAYLRNLQTYIECKKSNIWPGYSPKIQSIALKWH